MVEPTLIPEEYACPITRQIMDDPVVAADGFTYERRAITIFFENNNISPVTFKDFKNKTLVTNFTLLSKISKFKMLRSSIATSQTNEIENVVTCTRNMINAKEVKLDL
ncbi:unnamed protein product [Blepharisma stoltei]|uniref:U-box domain-containing protein n=1 Tax=Blepharisma stoltei TaxID=1481888 RepID=A0AAU9J9M2_9CILI|nr:unnamed protein product [Blepharisma stoltei]